jgi:hypothetical protein
MKTPNVCTDLTSYGEIVASNPYPTGGLTPRRNVDFLLQVPDLTLFNLIYSLTAGSNFGIRITFQEVKDFAGNILVTVLGSLIRNPHSTTASVLTKPLIIGDYWKLSAFEISRKTSPQIEPACTKNTEMYKITQSFFDHVHALITSAQRISSKEMLKNTTPPHPSLLYKTRKFSFAPGVCRQAF